MKLVSYVIQHVSNVISRHKTHIICVMLLRNFHWSYWFGMHFCPCPDDIVHRIFNTLLFYLSMTYLIWWNLTLTCLNHLFLIHLVAYLDLDHSWFGSIVYATSPGRRFKFVHAWSFTVLYLIGYLHFVNTFGISFVNNLDLLFIWI